MRRKDQTSGVSLGLRKRLSGSKPVETESFSARQRAGSLPLRNPLDITASTTSQLYRSRSKSTTDVSGRRIRSSTLPSHNGPQDVQTADEIYFQMVEPFPVLPPPYSWIAPGKPRPVYPNKNLGNETLPKYTPTVFKMATLMSKLEWVSPFEMAVQRHWKSYIVELNSTQLNLYYSDPEQALESLHHSRSHLFLHHSRSSSTVNTSTGMNTGTIVDSGTDISVDKLLLQADMDNQRYDSSMTTKDDIDRLHLFRNENLLTKSNMAKSYSLQYGKVGLAIDYKKKKFTLRLRLETEQFLLQFPCAEAMVEWYSALCLGIDNALDLNRRAMPRYRTVPRRRRHVRRTTERTPLIGRGRHHSIENLFRRRTGSSPEVGGFMSRLKMRFGSSSNIEADSSNNSIREESVTPSEHTEFSLGYSPESELSNATRSSRLHAPGGLSTGYFGVEPGASSDMLELPESQHSDGEDSEQVSTSNTHNDSEDDSENDVDYEAEDGIIDQTDIESDADLISRNDVMNDTDGIFFETSRTRGHTESSLRLPRQQRASSYCSVSATSVNAIGVPIPNIRYNGALCGRIGLSSSLSPCMSSESASASSPLSDMSSPGLVSTTPTTSIDSAGHNVHPIGCVAKEVEEEACSTCAHVPETDGRSSQESQERECTDEEEDRLSSESSERGGEPYVAFIEKLRSYVDVITIPARRRQIRDSMRCMMPLIGSERWAGRYLVKDAVRDYHPKPDVKDTKVLITKWEGLNETRYESFRPLQEYIVTPKGLAARINRGYEDRRWAA